MKTQETVKIRSFNGEIQEVFNVKHIPAVKTKILTTEDEEQRRKQCDGKLKHGSILGAKQYLYDSKENLEIYPCKFCGGFHLGHKNEKP